MSTTNEKAYGNLRCRDSDCQRQYSRQVKKNRLPTSNRNVAKLKKVEFIEVDIANAPIARAPITGRNSKFLEWVIQ